MDSNPSLINVIIRYRRIELLVAIIFALFLIPAYFVSSYMLSKSELSMNDIKALIKIAISSVLITFTIACVIIRYYKNARIMHFAKKIGVNNVDTSGGIIEQMSDVDLVIAQEYGDGKGGKPSSVINEMIKRGLTSESDRIHDNQLFALDSARHVIVNSRVLLSKEFIYIATITPVLNDRIIRKTDIVEIRLKEWYFGDALKILFVNNNKTRTVSIASLEMKSWKRKLKEYGYTYKD